MTRSLTHKGAAGTLGSRRFRLVRGARVLLVLVLLATAGAVLASAYYVLSVFALQSSMNFAPLSAFALVAGYRVFQEPSLPLPTFTSGTEAEGPPCVTAGMPTHGLAAGSPCRFFIELVGSPGPLPCSAWRGEVCNVVALPAEVRRNEPFWVAFQSYIDDPCRYVEDYRWLRDRLSASAASTAHVRYYARVIEADFRCAMLDDDQLNTLSVSGLWPRLRPHLLLEDASNQSASLIEVRIKPPGRREGVSGGR